MKQIVFKNGYTFDITKEAANTLKNEIIRGRSKNQVLVRGNNELDFMINIDEVILIKDI